MAHMTQILDSHGRPFSLGPSITKGPKPEGEKGGPKSVFFDPMTLMWSLGYKDKRFSMSYDLIRHIVKQVIPTAATVRHRINQVTQFTLPYYMVKDGPGLGFALKHKNRDKKLGTAEKEFISKLENFILFCGQGKNSKPYHNKREPFTFFTKKFIKDLLELDQGCFEIVPTKSGIPFEFIAIDGATIRIAADDPRINMGMRSDNFDMGYQQFLPNLGNRTSGLNSRDFPSDFSNISHVQVIRSQIETVYRDGELAFCILNPRTDLTVNGYGESNVELLIKAITAHLYAEQYNLNVFKQGSMPKGILNIQGETDPTMLEQFKRQWEAQVSGVFNSWRTPVLSSEGIQYIPVSGSNQEMEYQQWLNYLIRLQCAIWQIDPAEIAIDLPVGSGTQFVPPTYESEAEWKIKKSKDRGLRPLLRDYAYFINTHIIDRIDDHFYLDFVGLDELSQKEQIEIRQQEASVYKELNEVRKEANLDPVKDGDIILNPAYLQYKQMLINLEQMKMQMAMQQQQMEMQAQQQQVQQAQMQQEQEMAAQQSRGIDESVQTADMDAVPERSLEKSISHAKGYLKLRI